MEDAQRERLGLLLEQALSLPAEKRRPFVEDACGDDAELIEELTSLVTASEGSSGYFEDLAQKIVHPALAAVAAAEGDSDDAPDAHGARGSDAEIVAHGDVVSHYEIIERVGGGMGVVYRACDLRLGRTVALKFLPPALAADEAARERLHAEARAASTLDHPNIGVVYEIGETGRGSLFIVLAWYEGETLKEKLRRGPRPVGEAVDVARQVAAALAAAHEAGIVHRDVKPSNIICSEQGTAKLVDFGIAKVAGADDLTREGSTPGTVAYMSPEQTRGEAVDARTDVWSLGVVLYEMLTGRRPFRGESDATLIHAIRHDGPEPVERVRTDTPPALARIVGSCLAKDPSVRYAQASELLAELDALEDAIPSGESGQGASSERRRRRPEASGGRGPLLSRRLRTATLVAAAAVLAITGYVLRPSRDAIGRNLSATAVPADGRSALAVLPFENRSGRDEDQYFTDGLQDEIRTRLSGVGALRVSSRTSVMQYRDSPKNVREIGRELGVSHVLEGGVQRAGDSVRIFVRLVEAGSDTQIWTASYDAALDVAGLFAIQREIAESVAEALGAELTDAERTRVARVPDTDIEALRDYMRGRQHWNRRTQEGMDSAIVHFQAALRRDSSFAPAYAGLANVYVLGHGPVGTDGLPLAADAARSALRLDRDLAEAHASLGFALMLYEWNWPAADSAFRRAIDLDPSYATAHQWYAEFLASQGMLDEAVEQVRIAEVLDPLSAIIGWNVSRILGFARRHEEELAQLRRQADLHPHDDRIITSLVWSLIGFGRNEEAAEIMEDFVTPMMQEAGPGNADPVGLLLAGIRAGRAEALLTFFLESVPEGATGDGHQRMFTAIRHAMSGELDIAIGMIEEAYRERAFGLLVPDLAVGAAFDLFRDDPRFQNVLRSMGLDPEIGIRLRNRDPRWLAQR